MLQLNISLFFFFFFASPILRFFSYWNLLTMNIIIAHFILLPYYILFYIFYFYIQIISQRRKEYCKRDSKTYRPNLFSWWQIRFFFVSFAAIDFQDINLDLLFLLVLFYFSLYLHVRVDVMYFRMSQRL